MQFAEGEWKSETICDAFYTPWYTERKHFTTDIWCDKMKRKIRVKKMENGTIRQKQGSNIQRTYRSIHVL